MSKALILGGNGDIGKGIKNKLQLSGIEVTSPSSKELDLSSEAQIIEYFNKIGIEYDIFIHCAGINNPNNFDEISLEEYSHLMRINTMSFISCAQKIKPYWSKVSKGFILGISSIYGSVGRFGRAPYVMSKHALEGAVKTLAIELGQYNVLVNALSPGYVDTKLTRKNNTMEKIKSFENQIPLGRLANQDDIANVAAFLCSKENTYISGQNIIVDGGFLAGGFQN